MHIFDDKTAKRGDVCSRPAYTRIYTQTILLVFLALVQPLTTARADRGSRSMGGVKSPMNNNELDVAKAKQSHEDSEGEGQTFSKISVLVSIQPEAFFVEKIGGDHVSVIVLNKSGRSPNSYEPSSRELAKIAAADIYFSIGVPFEKSWIPRLRTINPKMAIVDLRKSLPSSTDLDPHVWNDPEYARVMSISVFKSLRTMFVQRNMPLDYPTIKELEENLAVLDEMLVRLNRDISSQLAKLKQRKFLVFHPAWNHFARRYGLQEISIERHGKEPGPEVLARIISQAKTDKIRTIFVQKQFDRRHAQIVAQEIGASIVATNPLSRNYIDGLRHFASALRAADSVGSSRDL